ncbi:hypothetical protein Q3G72_008083 [Acer saccharum]|nr:hypothetical protein Q3G72_008083 [Acer saccharum]
MLKRKREQQDIQLLARKGVVDSSKYRSNMHQIVRSRATNNLETQNNMGHVVRRGTCNNMESMSDDSETEEPSDYDIEETQDDAGSTRKKTRGRTHLQWLHLQKEPIQVKLNELRQPIGEPGKQLGQYIGFIAKFNIDWDLAEDWINKKINHLWRQRKHKLKKEYEKPSKDKEKIAKLINDVGQVQWDWLVKFWNSEKGKNRAKTNKQNYGKLEMHHTGGTKSFARLRDELGTVLVCRGEEEINGFDMKTFSKAGAYCLIVFSVVVIFNCQDTTLDSITARFAATKSSAIDIEEESCLSRNQSVLYRKSSPHKPSSYLVSKLRSYEELHKRCGPRTNSYKRSLKQLKSGQIDHDSGDCKYVVWVADCGLGNRILSITSAFLYALLTDRVLLINQEKEMVDLFCEPFPTSSWILPEDFPFKNKMSGFYQKVGHSYGNLLKSNTINYSTPMLPSYLYLYLSHDCDHDDQLFFCDQDQALLSKVPWLIMRSNVNFLPSMFLMSSFDQELDKLFPDKETVFHHLGSAKTSPFGSVMDQILGCIQKEKLLPEVDTEKSIASPSKNQTSKVILVTSLFRGYFEKLNKMYGEHPTKTGEVVAVYQPSNERKQQSWENSHNVQAWVEIYLLSLSDELVTSAWSTFGYVAQGLRGMRPLILYKIDRTIPDPPCGRGVSMEPCYHAPPIFDCKTKKTVDTTTFVPHVKHCEDIRWGIKLFNTST